jgi:hypothetical protein
MMMASAVIGAPASSLALFGETTEIISGGGPARADQMKAVVGGQFRRRV